jgi:hypothetical protein
MSTSVTPIATQRLIFVICAHKNPVQIGRLIRSLAGPGRRFFIHIDKKSPLHVRTHLTREIASLPDIHFLASHVCNWWDFGQVRSVLKAITAVVERGMSCDHLVFLTGQDYPIKPQRYMDALLGAHPGRSFLSYSRLPFPLWIGGGHSRYKRWYFTLGNQVVVLPNDSGRRYRLANLCFRERHLPSGLVPYGGWAYWCLARQAIEYVYDTTRRRPELTRFFRHVQIPDEMFFQTLLLNSPLADTIINTDLRFVSWPEPGATHPRILTMADMPSLSSSGALFARKFDTCEDSTILDAIDALILRNAEIPSDPHRLPFASLPVGEMTSLR